MSYKFIAIIVILSTIIPTVSASNFPTVTLSAPNDGNISTTKNITFECNISDDEMVYNISLYHNLNGTFELYNTRKITELENDVNTTLLCRFNGNSTCEAGETATTSNTDFVSSKFGQGIRVNVSDSLSYPTLNNINYDRGTVEFWVRNDYDTGSLGDLAYLFSTDSNGGASYNRMDLYIDYGELRFEVRDDYAGVDEIYKSVNWNSGEWHHIAITWDFYNGAGNGYYVNLFVDGSNSSTTVNEGFYQPGSSFGTNLYIGSFNNGAYTERNVFDEFRISDRVLTESEINESYQKGAGIHRNETATWTINNISDGAYRWACFAYDNESQGNWSETNFTLYIDSSTYPQVQEYIFSPPGLDAIDPNMVVNVTANVTDFTNVSSVMFQWKETGNWINDTMDYNNVTELFENASMTIDQTGGLYLYRIWSNDTWGNAGYSNTSNITADWDYTWSISPSTFGTVYGFVSCSDCYVGTLVINNTADDSMSFTISNDWPLGLSYNVSNPVSIAANQKLYVNVTADFASESSEYDVVLNVTASHGTQTPVPTHDSLTFSINSYTGGAYFDSDDVSVTNYETSVYQGMSYNLTMQIKNIGNETANNVSINWTLPSGWSNTSGNVTNFFPTLNGSTDGGNTITMNLTVYVSPSGAAAGVTNITLSAGASGGLSGNATVTTYVNCNNDDSVCGSGCSYVTDDDCSIPVSPGGGTSDGTTIAMPSAIKTYDIILELPERIDINRGETVEVQIGVKNDVSGTTLDNLRLSLSGYPQTFTKIVQSKINSIEYGKTEYFNVEISAPVYAVHEKYTLLAKVVGTFSEFSKETSAENTGEIPLVTHKTIANDTLKYYERAKEALTEIEKSEFESKQLKEMLVKIEESLDEGNYDKVKELSESLISKKNLAFELNEKITEMESNIESIKYQNGQAPEAEKMLFLAKSAFQRGEYDRANERMDSATLVYTLESANAWFTIFLTKYWWAIIIVLVLLVKVSFIGKNKLNVMGKISRLDTLSKEEEKIKGLIMELQKDFIKKKMSTKKYNEMMGNYESGGAEIRKERGLILSSLKDMVSHENALKLLTDEASKIKHMILYLQEKYFMTGIIGKEYYDRMMEGFKSELFDIEDSIDEIHVKKRETGKSAKRFGKMMPFIIFIILLSVTVSALETTDVQESIKQAENTISEMQALGFGVTYANDTLNEAKNLLENEYYEGADALAKKVIEIKQKAISVNNIINDVESKIYELSAKGYDVSEAEEIFNAGMNEFLLDNYVGAEEHMEEAFDKIDEIEAEESVKRLQQTDNLAIILDYLGVIVIVVFLLIIIYFKVAQRNKIKNYSKEKTNLEKEMVKLKDSIGVSQMKYFKNGTISKLDYEILVKKHTKKITDIKRRLSFLEEILSK